MGANLSQSFPTPEEADIWAEQQTRRAAQWNLQKTADYGNRPVVRVPVVSPAGQPEEITVTVEPGTAVEPRIHASLHKTRRFAGYREDPLRRRQSAYERSLHFD